MEFITPVKVILVDENLESVNDDVLIKWNLEVECRQWGVKSVYATMPKQEIEVQLQNEDDEEIEVRKIDVEDVETEDISKLPVRPVELEHIKGKWILKF